MSELPSPPALDSLRESGPVALFLDFDGTLVDLAPTPDGIAVPETLNAALHALGERLEGRLALVSGRAIVDIESHLGPVQLARAGSHGSDCRMADGTNLGDVPSGLSEDILAEIAQFAKEKGFAREDKPHGAALHYRSDPTLEGDGLAFANTLAAEHGLDVKRGKCVIELVGQGANKGSAVEAFMAEAPFKGATPVFIGDDVTDEDGFAAATAAGGFGILVGARESVAKFGLADPAAVHHWLGL